MTSKLFQVSHWATVKLPPSRLPTKQLLAALAALLASSQVALVDSACILRIVQPIVAISLATSLAIMRE